MEQEAHFTGRQIANTNSEQNAVATSPGERSLRIVNDNRHAYHGSVSDAQVPEKWDRSHKMTHRTACANVETLLESRVENLQAEENVQEHLVLSWLRPPAVLLLENTCSCILGTYAI